MGGAIADGVDTTITGAQDILKAASTDNAALAKQLTQELRDMGVYPSKDANGDAIPQKVPK